MTIEMVGLEAAIDRIEGLDDPEVIRPATVRAGDHIRDRLADYPPPSGKPQPFKTEKQRRYFFAALREGRIQVPYRRTQALARGWRVEVSANGREASITNDEPHAPYVQDRDRQNAYHRGTWQTAQDVAEREERAVADYYDEQYRRYAA